MKESTARAFIKGQKLCIEFPFEDFQELIDGSWRTDGIPIRMKVENSLDFAGGLCFVMNSEDEAGSTPIHQMLDIVFSECIDSGVEGIVYADEDE